MKKYSISIFILLFFLSCISFKYKDEITSGTWLKNLAVNYTYKGQKGSTLVQIYFPKKYKRGENSRTLIVLHGYNGNLRDWERNSGIEKYANDYNFVLVCPDMKKTLYETKFYPETTNKWGEIPGGIFVGEVLIDYLRSNFALCGDRNKTGIVGISTGARGALLLAEVYNNIFGAASGLSGDYDPISMAKTNEKILSSIYGEYNTFKNRWEHDDNILRSAERLKKTPVFLSHGFQDSVVPKEQSMMLAIKLIQLKKKKGNFDVVYKEMKYNAHDWSFWRRILPDVMRFFNEKL